MSFKLTGLDNLTRNFNELQRAMQSLDGPIAKIKVIPGNSASVESAIRKMNEAVDQRVAQYQRNPMVKDIVEAAKKHFAERIRARGKKSVDA